MFIYFNDGQQDYFLPFNKCQLVGDQSKLSIAINPVGEDTTFAMQFQDMLEYNQFMTNLIKYFDDNEQDKLIIFGNCPYYNRAKVVNGE